MFRIPLHQIMIEKTILSDKKVQSTQAGLHRALMKHMKEAALRMEWRAPTVRNIVVRKRK
ncbi:hypothetical protein MKZ01_10115 [Lysinibacillus endophyticus]|uniref:Uncharacterized protein n=1 Tax=Ureibacillus endophyticus TaxID=1978490 RepID=A0A494YZV2_9BACL|nr:hypothetical protein [Lysinibacillus endophyticus]MCP1145199.1 hypothetical protein [Lysinibacillus endophyticus]RKQ15788.1 hypothetical protein D8M03_11345 [Lysinibacillus endophyticus]